MEFGTQERRDKYMRDICTGKKIGAFSLTEPGAGSDAGGQQTSAALVGDVKKIAPKLAEALEKARARKVV